MSWEFHPASTAFTQHAADWDRLNGELYAGHPYFDSRFVGPLLEYFASGREQLCLYREHGVIRAALILLPRGAGRWANFRPAQAQITPLLVADARLLSDLLAALPGFAWSIEFHAVDPRFSPAFSYARGDIVVTKYARTIGIAPGLSFETYWRQRPNNLRRNIRRYANRAEREKGEATLTCFIDSGSMADGVRRFGDLESAGWKATAGTAISFDNIQGKFYAKVLGNFAATGQAEICELSIGGQLAASRLLIDNAHMAVILKTTFDETLARFAPSRLLLYKMLQRHMNEGAERTIEFYTNATRDQTEWATFSETIQNLHIFRGEGSVIGYSLFMATKKGLVHMTQPCWVANGDPAPIVEVLSSSCPETLVTSAMAHSDFAELASIENSLDWFGLLQQQIYPNDRNVRYYYVADSVQTKAILPLRLSQKNGIRTLESLSNYYTSLYSPLFSTEIQPDVFKAMLTYAVRLSGSTHVMRFAPMDPQSSEYAGLLQALRDAGWVPLTFFCFGNWFLKVDCRWDEYLKTRSGSLRSNIKRANSKFSGAGGTLELISSTQYLDDAIVAYNYVYAASWKKPEPYPDFVPSLIKLVAARGMLRLGIARMRGEPIAVQLWIVGKDKASIYKVAYDDTYAKYSPGTLLTSFLMKHVIEADGVAEVDFLIGDDKYKELWMSHRRERWGIIAFNACSVFGLLLLAKELAGRVAKKARRKLSAMLLRAQTALATMLRPYS